MIEEGVIIEQEGEHSQSAQIQRTRKQQIETINSEDDTNGTEKVENVLKKPKIEAQPIANTTGRTTRASASKTVPNETTDKTEHISNEEQEKSQTVDDNEAEDEELEEEEEEEDIEEEEQSEGSDQKEVQVSQKRTRGRPPKNVPSVSIEDDSSPQRKSARIAKKYSFN